MKNLISIFLIAFGISGYSQTSYNQIFSNAHGLTRGNMLYFEVEGYSGFTNVHDKLYFDGKGIKKAKKKYKIPKETQSSVDSKLNCKHEYFIADYVIKEGLIQKSIFYFVPTTNNNLKVIAFSRALERDKEVERLFVKSIVENTLPDYVITRSITDSIDFVGRKIYLGGVCRWMGPHNVQCPDYGQISWSTFRSINEAKKSAETNFQITANKGMGELLEKDSVNVIFEGLQATALKTMYKIKIPQLIMGGSNILIIYYVAEEIRGKSIACVMSQYADDVNAKELAPLIQEVMKLRE